MNKTTTKKRIGIGPRRSFRSDVGTPIKLPPQIAPHPGLGVGIDDFLAPTAACFGYANTKHLDNNLLARFWGWSVYARTAQLTIASLIQLIPSIGWFNMNDPNISRDGILRRFREILISEILRTCSMSPCQPVEERWLSLFFSFRQIFSRFVSGDIWALWNGIPISRRQKTKTHTFREPVDRDSQNTCGKIQDLSQKNGVTIYAFVRKTCVICVVAL